MADEIIINVHPLETRIAVLENSRLVELLVEKKDEENIVGNIYKGVVKDVLPGMGAAFIDIGIARTGFLHYSDIVTDFLDTIESDKHNLSQIERDSSQIGRFIKKGEEIIVQVQKGPLGKKGCRLTGQISIPGKFLIYYPNKNRVAISRKISNPKERDRIRGLLTNLKEKDVGLIVRTAAEGCNEEEFAAEYRSLKNTWRLVAKQIKHAKPPAPIFEENDLLTVLVRDLVNEQVERIVVDRKRLGISLRSRLRTISPDWARKVEFYEEDSPIFDAFGLEKEIESIFKSRIGLPSGGNIVIEPTEALVSIDINTGSFTGTRNYDQTVRTTNMEAAQEIGRQIRLRDLSGIMVIDFIDMRSDRHRQDVLDALKAMLRRDRAKNKVYPFGPLGLVEVTRKRTRPNLLYTYSDPCPHCHGTGRVLSAESVALKINRWLQRAEYFIKGRKLKLQVHPGVAEYLRINPQLLDPLSKKTEIVSSVAVHPGDFVVLDVENEKDLTHKYNA